MQWRRRLPSYTERDAWDLLLVRELSEWMRNDVYSEVLVGRMFVNLGMKFAEMACRGPATTAAVVDCPTHAEGGVENSWNSSVFLGGLA